MVECRYNVLVLELIRFDNIRWFVEIHHAFKRDNCLVTIRFISRVYNSRVQGVSGKTEQSAQTPWRGAPIGAGPNAAASVASA